MNKKSERGQVLILLLLIVLVVLTIVLAIAERSVSSLSNSDKTDQSSRAYSAAEAGVEQTIQSGTTTGTTTTSLSNQSTYEVSPSTLYPPSGNTDLLEYPQGSFTKSLVAQFWLDSPNSLSTGPDYSGNQLTLYFGNADMDITLDSAAAVEIDYVTCTSGPPLSKCGQSNSTYAEYKLLYDSKLSRTGLAGNGFNAATCPVGGYSNLTSELGTNNRSFRCSVPILISSGSYPGMPILMRVRLLYSNEPQALALAPSSASLPPQATIFYSTGQSGNSIVKLQVFQIPNVVSPFMDYALFSVKDISK